MTDNESAIQNILKINNGIVTTTQVSPKFPMTLCTYKMQCILPCFCIK